MSPRKHRISLLIVAFLALPLVGDAAGQDGQSKASPPSFVSSAPDETACNCCCKCVHKKTSETWSVDSVPDSAEDIGKNPDMDEGQTVNSVQEAAKVAKDRYKKAMACGSKSNPKTRIVYTIWVTYRRYYAEGCSVHLNELMPCTGVFDQAWYHQWQADWEVQGPIIVHTETTSGEGERRDVTTRTEVGKSHEIAGTVSLVPSTTGKIGRSVKDEYGSTSGSSTSKTTKTLVICQKDLVWSDKGHSTGKQPCMGHGWLVAHDGATGRRSHGTSGAGENETNAPASTSMSALLPDGQSYATFFANGKQGDQFRFNDETVVALTTGEKKRVAAGTVLPAALVVAGVTAGGFGFINGTGGDSRSPAEAPVPGDTARAAATIGAKPMPDLGNVKGIVATVGASPITDLPAAGSTAAADTARAVAQAASVPVPQTAPLPFLGTGTPPVVVQSDQPFHAAALATPTKRIYASEPVVELLDASGQRRGVLTLFQGAEPADLLPGQTWTLETKDATGATLQSAAVPKGTFRGGLQITLNPDHGTSGEKGTGFVSNILAASRATSLSQYGESVAAQDGSSIALSSADAVVPPLVPTAGQDSVQFAFIFGRPGTGTIGARLLAPHAADAMTKGATSEQLRDASFNRWLESR